LGWICRAAFGRGGGLGFGFVLPRGAFDPFDPGRRGRCGLRGPRCGDWVRFVYPSARRLNFLSTLPALRAGPPPRVKIQGWRKRIEAVEWRRKFKFSKIIDLNLRPPASGRADSGVTPRNYFHGKELAGAALWLRSGKRSLADPEGTPARNEVTRRFLGRASMRRAGAAPNSSELRHSICRKA